MATLPKPAARVASYRPSGVREIFARANEPGTISLAGGSPYVAALPLDELADQAASILRSSGAAAMQYSFGVGIEPLRRLIAELLALEGMNVDPDDVMVTAGSQLGLEALCKLLLDPDDVVIAEGPAYAGGLSALVSYGADVWHVRTDNQGCVPEHLEDLLDRAESEGRTVKLVYCMPTFQNPRNSVMGPDRRERLVALAESHGALLVEDNAYGLLAFDGSTRRAIRADHPDQVAYLGSFSKIVGPGLRLGWLVAPAPYRQALKDTIETFILNPPTLGQFQMVSYLTNSDWRGHLERMRTLYQRRCEALLGALEASMPDVVRWQRPQGSFYLWLEFPESIDSEALVLKALDRGVAFVPGTAFYVDGQGKHSARLSYCLPTEEDLARAGRILGELVTEELASGR